MQYLETMKEILPLVLLFLSTTMLTQNIPSIEQVEGELEELKKKDDLRTYALNVIKTYEDLLQAMQENIDNSQEDITELNNELRRAHAKFTSSLDSATWVNSQLSSELQELSDSLQHLEHTIDSLIQGNDIMPITRENTVFSSSGNWDNDRNRELNERIISARGGWGEWPNSSYYGDLTLKEELTLIDSAIKMDFSSDHLNWTNDTESYLPRDTLTNIYRLSHDNLTFYLVQVLGSDEDADINDFKNADSGAPGLVCPVGLYQISKDGYCSLLSSFSSITIPYDKAAEILNINPLSGFFSDENMANYGDSSEFNFEYIEDIYVLNNKAPFLVGITSTYRSPILEPEMSLTSLFLITEDGLNTLGHFPLFANQMAEFMADSINKLYPCVDFSTSLSFSKSDYSYGLPNIIYTKTYNNYMSENLENYSYPCHDIGPHDLIFTFDGKQYILQEDE